MTPDKLRSKHEENEEWMNEHADAVLGHGIAPQGQDIEELQDEFEQRQDENRRIEKYLNSID